MIQQSRPYHHPNLFFTPSSFITRPFHQIKILSPSFWTMNQLLSHCHSPHHHCHHHYDHDHPHDHHDQEGEPTLITPCLCCGSLKFVHQVLQHKSSSLFVHLSSHDDLLVHHDHHLYHDNDDDDAGVPAALDQEQRHQAL